jgi:hypothetical protein
MRLLGPRGAIPVSGAGALAAAARRTTRIRLGLAVLAVVLLAAVALLATNMDARPSSYFASGGSGVVVFDLSTSVDPARYQRLSRVLHAIVETNQPVGVVVYSDTAYEMMPPGTRGSELRPLLRFFEPPGGFGQAPAQPQPRLGSRDVGNRGGFGFPDSPWGGSFRGGTRISTGLAVARQILERDGVSPPSVLLVSDLDDSAFDTNPLTQELIRYEREGIRLRIVPLFPAPDDRQLFSRLAGPEAFVANDEILANTALEERRTLVGSFPFAFVAVAALLLLVLALNERVCARLRWRPGAAEAALAEPAVQDELRRAA